MSEELPLHEVDQPLAECVTRKNMQMDLMERALTIVRIEVTHTEEGHDVRCKTMQ